MIAQVCNMIPGDFIHTFGDVHIYKNHMEQVKTQLTREPRALPKMYLNPAVKDIDSFIYDDFTLVDYNPWPAIKGDVAV
jgi:thymidylate synthase